MRPHPLGQKQYLIILTHYVEDFGLFAATLDKLVAEAYAQESLPEVVLGQSCADKMTDWVKSEDDVEVLDVDLFLDDLGA